MEKKYGLDDIRVVSPCEAVRLRPKIHFEQCFTDQNLNAFPFELACHAFDEYFDGNCTSLNIQLFKDHFAIQYNAGMSLSQRNGEYNAVSIMSSLFTCSNEKKHLSVGEEFCKLGMATINFASEYCTLTTVSEGKRGVFQFERGELIALNVEDSNEVMESTEIILKPDAALFNDLKLTRDGILSKMEELRPKLVGLELSLQNLSSHEPT